MELEELKTAWETLNEQLKRDSAINLAMYTGQKLTLLRSRLRPLFVGQILQIFFGIAFLLLAAALWSTRPKAMSVIVAGVVVHAYGIACIILAGVVMGAITNIDYSGSVLEIQEKLARVRRAYIVGGIVGGLTWWFLWIPVLMVLLALVHVNLYAHAPSVIWGGLAVGAVGLAGMLWVYAYSRKPEHNSLRRFIDQAVVGRSLQRAQAQLEEVRHFAREAA
jgi:phage shock protein PspC (stress-responsive transcriptional regulator)